MSTRSLTALALGLAALLAAPLAAAEPSPADKETARALMRSGRKLAAGGDLKGALKAYRGAHAIMNVSSTGLAVARTLEQQGRLLEARGVCIEVVHAPLPPNASKHLYRARSEAGALAKSIEPRLVSLTVKPEGLGPDEAAAVFIDAQRIPDAAVGLPRRLDPGPHVIRIEAPGRAVASRKLKLEEGARRVVALRVGRRVAAATPASKPASAPVEGSACCSTPARPDSGPNLWGWGLTGAGALTLAAGLALDVAVLGGRIDDFDESRRAGDGEAAGLKGEVEDLQRTTAIVYGAGAALVASGALVLWLSDDGPSVTPTVGPDHAGAALRLAW